jgi:Tol biopolymer transport system component
VRRTLSLVAVAAGALVALAPAASATLVYTTQPAKRPPILWAADNGGGGAIPLGRNYSGPRISPDGQWVLAVRQSARGANQLYLLPTGGGGATRLLTSVQADLYAWSPTSQLIAAVTGRRLAAIDVASGAATDLANGIFAGASVSFSPFGDQIAYTLATSTGLNAATDVYAVPVAGGPPTQLTVDGTSTNPAWGPTQIAYSRGPRRRSDYPQLNLWLMNPDGSEQRQLTFVGVRSLVTGLNPVQWSASGAQLLANYGGQDTSQAFAVDPLSGGALDLGARSFDGTSPGALSRDGTTVLAQTGGQEGPGRGRNTVAIPFGGGPPTVLVPGGLSPDWNA